MTDWRAIKVKANNDWMSAAVDMDEVIAATEGENGFVRLQLRGGGSIDAKGALSDFIDLPDEDDIEIIDKE